MMLSKRVCCCASSFCLAASSDPSCRPHLAAFYDAHTAACVGSSLRLAAISRHAANSILQDIVTHTNC